ncbi:uncharacterized protein [Ptychodera flava]|uniref:uncharacterized protein n=1 Tax=Ptychodera flava TaxID=63121 RepID=UPI00396A5581
MSSLLSVLQISDSAFPTGSFSYSLGLEASVQYGYTNGTPKFKVFVMSCLENAGSFNLPFVRTAYEKSENLNEIRRIDSFSEACVNNHVENRASRRQGNSLVDTAIQAFSDERFQNLQQAIESQEMRGHFPVIFGCTCAYLNISLDVCLEAFMFGVLRTVIASAVRLGTVGSLEGQKCQYDWQKVIPDIIERNRDKSIEDACLSFPLVDITENAHDTLFSRLFHS